MNNTKGTYYPVYYILQGATQSIFTFSQRQELIIVVKLAQCMQTLFTKYYLTMESLSCLYPLGFYEELNKSVNLGKGLHGGPCRPLAWRGCTFTSQGGKARPDTSFKTKHIQICSLLTKCTINIKYNVFTLQYIQSLCLLS